MNLLDRLLIAATAVPMKCIDRRWPWLEARIGLDLNEADIHYVREASPGRRLGAYYHWYLQKRVVARQLKGIDREQALARIQRVDHSDYRPLQSVIESKTGVLVAIPHHAHYVLGMTAMAHALGAHKPVNVFYAKPEDNPGNAVFDHLHDVLFGDPASGVRIIHNTRQGLVQAIKALRRGEVVVIMPDAVQDEDAAMMFPFCGRLMNGMLGTASLARMTGSWVLPAIAHARGDALGFRTWFGEPLKPAVAADAKLSADEAKVLDYALMSDLYSQLEGEMGADLYRWQNVRQHLAFGGRGELAMESDIEGAVERLAHSFFVKPPAHVLDLR